MRLAILAGVLGLAAGSLPALADTVTIKTHSPSSAMTQKDMGKQAAPADLYFNVDSAAIDDAAVDEQLSTLAKAARCNKSAQVLIEGHADISGTNDYNVKLSAERAQAVRDKLVSMGVRPQQIVLVAYGEEKSDSPVSAHDRRATASIETSNSTMSDGG